MWILHGKSITVSIKSHSFYLSTFSGFGDAKFKPVPTCKLVRWMSELLKATLLWDSCCGRTNVSWLRRENMCLSLAVTSGWGYLGSGMQRKERSGWRACCLSDMEACEVPVRFQRKPVWPASCMRVAGKEFLNQNPYCCAATAAIICLDSPAGKAETAHRSSIRYPNSAFKYL